MDVMDALLTRRSIRKYTDQPVPEEVIQDMLKAAFMAPSAADQRPWHFVLIRDIAVLRELGQNMESCEMLDTAQLGFLICGDTALEQIPGYWTQDCSACAENVLLAIHANGLGAVWVAVQGVPPRENALRDALGIPESITPFALITVGYPDENPASDDRTDSARIHDGQW